MFFHPRPPNFKDIVKIVSRQGVIVQGSFDGVGETIDSTTSTLEIHVGAYQPEGRSFHQHLIGMTAL
jgi:hypothetical protein